MTDHVFLYSAMRHILHNLKIVGDNWKTRPFTMTRPLVWLNDKNGEIEFQCWDYAEGKGGWLSFPAGECINKGYLKVNVYKHVIGGKAVKNMDMEITEKGFEFIRNELREFLNSKEIRVINALSGDPIAERLYELVSRFKEKVGHMAKIDSNVKLIYDD